LRDEEVAAITIGNLLDIPGASEFVNVFDQQYFHFLSPFWQMMSGRRVQRPAMQDLPAAQDFTTKRFANAGNCD
ncbi:MAG TPA: hypothetical protein PLE14_00615, partial [Anaerolineales bacterium]|nr:hypothetical protein [Anaerolineales bacterium]